MARIPIVRDVPVIPARTICTLGYAKITQTDLLKLLAANPDAVVVETRRTPYSRVHLNFNGPVLLDKLTNKRYLWASKELGNQKGDGHHWEPVSGMPVAMQYLMWLQTALDNRGQFPIFLCCEADHRQCHRGWRDGVADLARSLWDGWKPEILHIWSDGVRLEPKLELAPLPPPVIPIGKPEQTKLF